MGVSNRNDDGGGGRRTLDLSQKAKRAKEEMRRTRAGDFIYVGEGASVLVRRCWVNEESGSRAREAVAWKMQSLRVREGTAGSCR